MQGPWLCCTKAFLAAGKQWSLRTKPLPWQHKARGYGHLPETVSWKLHRVNRDNMSGWHRTLVPASSFPWRLRKTTLHHRLGRSWILVLSLLQVYPCEVTFPSGLCFLIFVWGLGTDDPFKFHALIKLTLQHWLQSEAIAAPISCDCPRKYNYPNPSWTSSTFLPYLLWKQWLVHTL